MMKIIIKSYIIAIIFAPLLCKSKITEFDSLKIVLGNLKNDTLKVNCLIALGKTYPFDIFSLPDSAIYYEKRAKELAIKIDYKKGIAQSLNYIGDFCFRKRNYAETINYWQQASETYNELSDNSNVFTMQSNIGALFFNIRFPDKSNEFYFNALKSADKMRDTLKIIEVLNNIGAIYQLDPATYDKAIEYHTKSYNLSRMIKNSANKIEQLTTCLDYLGESYMFKETSEFLDSAAIYFEIAWNKNRGTINEAYTLNRIGELYLKRKEYDKAIQFQKRAVEILRGFEYKNDSANSQFEAAKFYLNKGNFIIALQKFKEVESIVSETKDMLRLQEIYKGLASIYNKEHDYSNSFKYDYLSARILETFFKIDDGKRPQRLQLKLNLEMNLQNKLLDKGNDIYLKTTESKILIDLAKSYFNKEGYNIALQIYKEAELIAIEIKSYHIQKEIYKGIIDIYSNQHDYSNSLKYQKLLFNLQDNIYGLNVDETMEGIKYLFENDHELNLKLLQNEKNIQSNTIKSKTQMRNRFVGGMAIVIIFTVIFYIQKNRISNEKKRSDDLLLNILPEEVAEELKQKGSAEAKQFDEVTVMFTDFKGFTQISEKLSPSELVAEIDTCFKAFDNIMDKFHIEKIKTIGDSYMCAGGLPVANKTNATDVINAALEIQQFMKEHQKQRIKEGKEVFEIRIGVNTGPVVAGIVGVKKFAYDIWGDTVNIASRMESSGEAGKVNISGTTYELIKDKFNCSYRGKVKAKNKGEIDMYFVEKEITS